MNLGDMQRQVIDAIQMTKGITFQEKLDSLAECNCCDRHQTNKPKLYKPWNDVTSNFYMWHESFVQCECECRHIARWICRTCQSENIKIDTNKKPRICG